MMNNVLFKYVRFNNYDINKENLLYILKKLFECWNKYRC